MAIRFEIHLFYSWHTSQTQKKICGNQSLLGVEFAGPIFSYKLRYIVGFGLVEMAISTNPKPTIYCSLTRQRAQVSTVQRVRYICKYNLVIIIILKALVCLPIEYSLYVQIWYLFIFKRCNLNISGRDENHLLFRIWPCIMTLFFYTVHLKLFCWGVRYLSWCRGKLEIVCPQGLRPDWHPWVAGLLGTILHLGEEGANRYRQWSRGPQITEGRAPGFSFLLLFQEGGVLTQRICK